MGGNASKAARSLPTQPGVLRPTSKAVQEIVRMEVESMNQESMSQAARTESPSDSKTPSIEQPLSKEDIKREIPTGLYSPGFEAFNSRDSSYLSSLKNLDMSVKPTDDNIPSMPEGFRKTQPKIKQLAEGFLSSGEIKSILIRQREEPEKWTNSRIATSFKLEQGIVDTFFQYHKAPVIITDLKGSLIGYWEIPESVKKMLLSQEKEKQS